MNDLIRIMAVICTLLPAAAQAQALGVTLPGGRATTVTLDTLERRTVVTQDRGLKTAFGGWALRDVLQAAGMKLGEALRDKAMAQAVLVTARDGYQVVFAIAELDAAFTDEVVLLADQRDGRPLLPDTGPLQVIAPGDKRAARWIRQVSSIEVRQLP